MSVPTFREHDHVLLGRVRNSIADTAAQLEANARYYMDAAAKLRALRSSFTPATKPPVIILREIVEMLSDAGVTHTGAENSSEVQEAGVPGWTAARILLGEIFFHAGVRYDKDDEASVREYRIATGQEQPEPEPTAEQRRAYAEMAAPYLHRVVAGFTAATAAFSDMHAAGAL